MEGAVTGCKTKLKQFPLGIKAVLCSKLAEDQNNKKGLQFELERFWAQE